MDNTLQQQVAIVTGAGQGIGYEICWELAKNGASVILNDIDEELTNLATEKINKHFKGNCYGIAGNAADPAFIQQMVEIAVEKYGRLTIAIANAGITVFGDFFTCTPEDLQKITHLNLGGSFFLAQAASRQIIKQEGGGTILFMSSVTGHQAHKNLAAYGMTKAALEMLAKSLVVELSPQRITVNAIAPGATLTERTMQDTSYKKTWSSITPLGRPAYTSDIAGAALFLISEKARHITGQSIVIDGGWTCTSPSPYE